MATVPKEKLAQTDVQLDMLHAELERLHSLYEQHFAGVLKREPQREHQAFKAKFSALGPNEMKTTASKFRHQGLQQKYIQYNTLWSKVLKQIEEGTYHRDLFLLEKKMAATSEQIPKPKAPDVSVKKETAPGRSSKALDSLYEKMRGMVSDSARLPPKEKFVAALQKQIEDQKKKNPDKKIEIKLQKDTYGRVQVKLGLQKK